MSETLQPKKRRTWRTWLLRAVLVLVALVAVGVVAVWWRLTSEYAEGKAALAAVEAELDATDPGWRWEEIEASRAPIHDEQNSALAVKRARDSCGAWKPWEGKRPDGSDLFQRGAAINQRLDDEAWAFLRQDFAAHEPTVALAVRLKDLPRGRATIRLADNPIETLLPHLDQTRAVVGILGMDVLRLLHAGRTAETPDRVRAILRASASVRDDGLLLSTLVRTACRAIAIHSVKRILAMGEVPDAACRQLAADLEAERAEELMLPAIRGERAMFHRLFQNLASGKVPFGRFGKDEPVGNDPWSRLNLWGYTTYRLPEDHATMLRRLTEISDIARLPLGAQPMAWEVFHLDFTQATATAIQQKRCILTHMMLPNARRVVEAALRDNANLSCTVAALAAERYRLAHKRWPAALADLVPAYLSEVPTDPYTGEPIRLAKHEAGIVIYSVGEDGADDGGDVDVPETGYPPDLGVRLFDPAQRGLPSVAK